jgi:DNA replication and repair protein RecF
MRITRIRIQHFRNVGWLDLRFDGKAHWFAGANGQGKSNLLEALGLISALRSFRTSDPKVMLPWAAGGETRLWCAVEHDLRGSATIEILLTATRKQLRVDDVPVSRLADHLGQFPTVCLSAADIQLLRGGPQVRRQFLDSCLASADPEYFMQLRRYQQSLLERNALLRQRAAPSLIEAFSLPLAESGVALIRLRDTALAALGQSLTGLYQQISPVAETPELIYRPSGTWSTVADYLAALAASRERDLRMESTQIGPHRDDFSLRLQDHRAREFASEGQQRGLVLALRLAQLEWLRQRSGVRPVLIADDILGELDPVRQQRFWQALDPALQIFASATRPPPPGQLWAWERWQVAGGAVTAADVSN